METKGIEHPQLATTKTTILGTPCAKSGARSAPECRPEAGFCELIEVWPHLPADVREEILRLAGLSRE